MKLNSIQCLRAVAALLVVYVHSIDLQMGFSVSKQQNFFHLQNFGAIGVDLFFVISGFIITFVANKYTGQEQGIYFLVKRFRRINPVYYIASILYFVVLVLPIIIEGKAADISVDNTIGSLIDTILILPAGGHIFSYSPMLMIGWSLAFEWLFYILFFFLIVSKTKNKALFFGLFITGLVSLGYLLKVPDLRYIFITNPIILEFLLGVIICQLYLKGPRTPNWVALTCLLLGIASYLLLIIIGFGWLSEFAAVLTGVLSMKRFLLWGIPSAVIAFGCIFLERNNKFTSLWNNKWILLSGDASYSIYLVHLTVFELFRMLYKESGFFMPADLSIIVQVAVATIISIGFYKWIEQPMINAAQRNTKRKPTIITESVQSATPAPVP